MQLGIAFPTLELTDPRQVRAFAQEAERLGFGYLTALEHTLGTWPNRPDGRDAYTPDMFIHEPLVLFGYLAGLTERIELVTSVLILPQRQAVVVARQAAEVDHLSGGRLRLGVGLGNSAVEAEGVGSDFSTRGARVEEQVAVMRALWTQREVTFHGRWHHIERAGLTVLPDRQPIPVWFGGGGSARTLERIGRIGDGWIATGPAAERIAAIRAAAVAAGRPAGAVGIQGRFTLTGAEPEAWRYEVAQWGALGATHLTVNTRGAGSDKAAVHLRTAERFLREVWA
jgi:probable F420-dependent oxidoreductase